jgi:hypothetical protein
MFNSIIGGGSASKRLNNTNSLLYGANSSLPEFWEIYNTENSIKQTNNREVFITNKLTVYDIDILSDEKYKSNIIDILGIDINNLKYLKPKKYIMNNKEHYGFIAQEVEKLFPVLVNNNENETKTIKYHEFIPLLLLKINRLEEYIDLLEKRINSLENK